MDGLLSVSNATTKKPLGGKERCPFCAEQTSQAGRYYDGHVIGKKVGETDAK